MKRPVSLCMLTVILSGLVKIQGVNLDMKQILDVNRLHNVKLTLNRDTKSSPSTFWDLDQCFSIVFNNPYLKQQGCTQSTPTVTCYSPFDPANLPKCTVSPFLPAFFTSIGRLSYSNFSDTLFYFSSAPKVLPELTAASVKIQAL